MPLLFMYTTTTATTKIDVLVVKVESACTLQTTWYYTTTTTENNDFPNVLNMSCASTAICRAEAACRGRRTEGCSFVVAYVRARGEVCRVRQRADDMYTGMPLDRRLLLLLLQLRLIKNGQYKNYGDFQHREISGEIICMLVRD